MIFNPFSHDFSEEKFDQETSAETFSASEKFELLSAYLDGEVSDQERRLVMQWLLSDPQLQKHYQAQLKLRQAMRSFSSDYSIESGPDEDASSDAGPHRFSISIYKKNLAKSWRHQGRSDAFREPLLDMPGSMLCLSIKQRVSWQSHLFIAIVLGIAIAATSSF
ncbi:MAG: RseA family anti-sigma factor [Phormidesmis sp.]